MTVLTETTIIENMMQFVRYGRQVSVGGNGSGNSHALLAIRDETRDSRARAPLVHDAGYLYGGADGIIHISPMVVEEGGIFVIGLAGLSVTSEEYECELKQIREKTVRIVANASGRTTRATLYERFRKV